MFNECMMCMLVLLHTPQMLSFDSLLQIKLLHTFASNFQLVEF